MKPFISSLCIAFYILLASCNPSEAETNELITIPIKATNAVSVLPYSKLIWDIEYIPLSQQEEYLIGKIDKLVVRDDNFYILDKDLTHSVFKYTMQGKQVWAISNRGAGPGEYNEIYDISVSENNLYILPNKQQSILKYDTNGSYVERLYTGIYGTELALSKEDFLLYVDYIPNTKYSKNNSLYNLFIINEQGKIRDRQLPFPLNTQTKNITSMVYSIFSYNSTTLIFPTYSQIIYHYNNQKLDEKYYLDLSPGKQEAYEEIRNNKLTNPVLSYNDIIQYFNKNGLCRIIQFAENMNHLHLVYTFKDTFHFYFYDKNTKASVDLSQHTDVNPPLPVVNDIDGLLYYPIIGAHEEYFYSWCYAYALKNGLKKVDKKAEDIGLSNEYLDNDDNILLIKYQIREL